MNGEKSIEHTMPTVDTHLTLSDIYNGPNILGIDFHVDQPCPGLFGVHLIPPWFFSLGLDSGKILLSPITWEEYLRCESHFDISLKQN